MAEVGHNLVDHPTPATVLYAASSGHTHTPMPLHFDHARDKSAGGYVPLDRLRAGATTPEAIIDALDGGGLRGLGGAGFPTARKWRGVRAEKGPHAMAINADEGEPGTYKDRYYLGHEPHRFLEGMLIGTAVVEASDVYIDLRDEYPAVRKILDWEIPKPPGGGPVVHPRRDAGAYLRGSVGLRSHWVSGRVKKPGVKLASAGVTIREPIEEYCGGMADGHSLHAHLPGGASGGIRPASLRARARRRLQAQPDRRNEGDYRQRPRQDRAQDGDGTVRRRPAGARHLVRCRHQQWAWANKQDVGESRIPAAERWHGDASHTAMRVNLDACLQCGLCGRGCREVQVNDLIGMAPATTAPSPPRWTRRLPS